MDGNARTWVVVFACLLAGCADRVTGPQAVRMASALEEQHGEMADQWGRLNTGGAIPWLHGLGVRVPTIRLERDGRPVRYHALVYERRLAWSHDLGPDNGCWGERRSLYLWSPDRPLRAVILTGGDSTGTFGTPLRRCPDVPVFGPALWVTASELAPSEPSGYTHEQLGGREGSSLLSPGTARGPCTFLAPGAAELLLEELGATCEMTQHRVSLTAQLEGHRYRRRQCGEFNLPYVAGAARPVRIELEETVVIGVRLTFDCSLEAARRSCLPEPPHVFETTC